MATFSIGTGLASGIDYNSMVQKLMQLERKPLDIKIDRQKGFETKISKYGELSSILNKLKTAADGLKTAASFYTRQTEAGNKDVLSVSAASAASEGNYTVDVTQLAQANRIASLSSFQSGTSEIATGPGKFAFTMGSGAAMETVEVDVEAGMTLDGLASAINSATDSAEASVINDGSGWRLVLKGATTGAANAINITNDDSDASASGWQTLQAAQDAKFSIDGLEMTRSSNNVENAINGVSITLKSQGTSTISVTNDTKAIQEKVQSFVNAYNDVVRVVSNNNYYNSTTGVAGAFMGESTARDVVNQLEGVLGARVEGLPESLRTLSQIGVSTQRDGTLKLDTKVLAEKMSSDLDGVAKVFTGDKGIAGSVSKYVDSVTNSSGSISSRTKGLQSVVSRLSSEVEKGEASLKKREESLMAQFARMETVMSKYSSWSSSLSSIISMSSPNN